MELWLNRILRRIKTEGFGNRFCTWVQGCSIYCLRYVNQRIRPFSVGEKVQVECLVSNIANTRLIEGITLLGEELLNQKEAMAQLIEAVKRQGLSIILFTGYLYDDLKKSRDIYVQRILRNIDLMIDGPSIENRLDFSRPWTGPESQKCTFLSDKYSERDLVDIKAKSQCEVRIYPDGSVKIDDTGDLKKIRKFLKVDGGMV